MIFAIDVHYNPDESAKVAGVLFENWEDATPLKVYTTHIEKVNPYESGSFYKRELPCILAILELVQETIEYIVVDGYVYLNDKKGLGAHLYHALNEQISIIGVAKSAFRDIAEQTYLYRGESTKPLYVTSVGVELSQAKEWVETMHGKYRFPTLLKEVDRLCRE